MELAATVQGDGPPVLIVHGLFGSARNWGAIAKRMAGARRVTTPDMRNHGESPWSDSHSYADQADDLAPLAGGDVIGHSMGGKAAMALALTRPDLVQRLVVADISPVTYTHSQMPMIDAMRAVDPATVTTRSAADHQLSAHVDDPSVRAFLLQSLDVKGQRWRLNLNTLAHEMDKITGWAPIGAVYTGPTLFLSGGASDYVQRAHRPEIKALFPNARFASLPGAGHWLHAERPKDFLAAVEAFFDLTG